MTTDTTATAAPFKRIQEYNLTGFRVRWSDLSEHLHKCFDGTVAEAYIRPALLILSACYKLGMMFETGELGVVIDFEFSDRSNVPKNKRVGRSQLRIAFVMPNARIARFHIEIAENQWGMDLSANVNSNFYPFHARNSYELLSHTKYPGHSGKLCVNYESEFIFNSRYNGEAGCVEEYSAWLRAFAHEVVNRNHYPFFSEYYGKTATHKWFQKNEDGTVSEID
jgi:hypothetical protein